MKPVEADSQTTFVICSTYLLYVTFHAVLILGGCGYAVFVLGHSGWWFLLAFYMCCCLYKPARWRELWMPADDES